MIEKYMEKIALTRGAKEAFKIKDKMLKDRNIADAKTYSGYLSDLNRVSPYEGKKYFNFYDRTPKKFSGEEWKNYQEGNRTSVPKRLDYGTKGYNTVNDVNVEAMKKQRRFRPASYEETIPQSSRLQGKFSARNAKLDASKAERRSKTIDYVTSRLKDTEKRRGFSEAEKEWLKKNNIKQHKTT